MDKIQLQRLGVEEIAGGDVFGGEIAPWLIRLGIIVASTTIGSVAANWADFKDGLFEGYNDATH